MRRETTLIYVGVVLAGLLAGAVWAWHAPGHGRAAVLAVEALPEDVPAFFRNGADAIAASSGDPDIFKKPFAGETLDAAEGPEHYLDWELIEGMDLPPTRYAFLRELYARKLDPKRVGLLPYAVVEWTQRLTAAFAEHRRWPDDPHISRKCLVYAGNLAHYAADLCMPLHTTVHYDGRADENGKSPRSGIHLKADGLLQKLPAGAVTAGQLGPVAYDDLFPAVMKQYHQTRGHVDRLYELEADIPDLREPLPADGPIVEFSRDRLREAAEFTASLYLTAWRDSAKVEVPGWHRRPR